MTFLRNIAIIFVVIYFVLLALLYVLQRKVLYIPPPVYLTPAAVELPQAVETPQGWWIAPSDDTKPVVMFFHGNGSAVFSNHDIYRDFAARGYGVYALGFPGYPGYAGATTQKTVTQAALGGYDFVRAQGVDARRIVYYGTSLGAGVAAQLTTTHEPALLIMEAPFNSAADMAQMRFPIFPARALTKDKFDSAAALSGRDVPMLWLHGTTDGVIPMREGQRLYENYSGPKTKLIIPGGQHTNLWALGGRATIFDAIENIR